MFSVLDEGLSSPGSSFDWSRVGNSFGGNWLGAAGDAFSAWAAWNLGKKNYNLQQQAFDWQRGLQNFIFNREDNAVQRRVKDLIKAGLSPTLAAGSAARAGEAIRVTAPQYDMKVPQLMQSALKDAADISKTLAETDYINAQAARFKTLTPVTVENAINENKLLKDTLDAQIKKIQYESVTAGYKQMSARYIQEMDATEMQFYTAFKDYLVKQGGRYNVDGSVVLLDEANPYVIDYLASKTMYELKKMDKDFFENLQIGGAGTNTAMKLLEMMVRMLR